MKTKTQNIVKRVVDVALTVLLLLLMAYQSTGNTLHEWFGVSMTAVLILHHLLNLRWYGSLFKGKYDVVRIVVTVVNTLLFASIAITALSGMAMSVHAVPFLYGFLPIVFARQMHLAMSYWSFVLMGLHLGLHIPAMVSGVRWKKPVRIVLLSAFAAGAAAGFFFFFRKAIPDYLFFRAAFAVFEYGKHWALLFLENVLMLTAFAFAGCSFRLIVNAARKRKKEKS